LRGKYHVSSIWGKKEKNFVATDCTDGHKGKEKDRLREDLRKDTDKKREENQRFNTKWKMQNSKCKVGREDGGHSPPYKGKRDSEAARE
jgi:hypothetical protein